MESCITRISAEKDMRSMGVQQSISNRESLVKHRESLVLQMGEVYKIKRSLLVKAEPGALNKLRNLM